MVKHNLLPHGARLRKQSGVNRLKVEHYRTLTISRGFYDLLLKLDRRRLLVHGARLRKQSGTSRENLSTKGLGHYDKWFSGHDVGVDWAESSGLRSSTKKTGRRQAERSEYIGLQQNSAF
ncbi:hypothetical protein [Ligilactobacillus acidipiscis]|uniref:hypothetical protein n=1 Tax=Ligilactobacillus acidipiscis TaxID=89059 RepID=UPI002FDADE25